MDLGDILYEKRIERGISGEELCKEICSPSTYSRIEKNKALPDKIVLDRIMERLGLDPFKMEFVDNDKEYALRVLQLQIEQSIKENRLEEALKLLEEYEGIRKKSFINLYNQYSEMSQAKVYFLLGNMTKANKKAKEALNETHINVKAGRYENLSFVEAQAVFYYAITEDDGIEELIKLNDMFRRQDYGADRIELLMSDIQYNLALKYHRNEDDEKAIKMLNLAEEYLKANYLIGNIVDILRMKKEIMRADFNQVTILSSLEIISSIIKKGTLDEKELGKWENLIRQEL